MIHLFVTGFGRPDLLHHQKRLLDKHLQDDHQLIMVDNTPPPANLEQAARKLGIEYHRAPSPHHLHPDALNFAARTADQRGYEYWGTLDHDVFAFQPTTLIDHITQSGFFGVGQTYRTRMGGISHQYLWPGWSFWSRDWLAGRIPDFDGIRGEHKWDDGDCGSMMWVLFTDQDWACMARGSHEYGLIRPEDEHGLQSFGFETFNGSWLHLTNASYWKDVPDKAGRDRLFLDMLEGL